MQKRPGARSRRRRSNARRILSVILSILIPPVGIFLVWRTRWSNNARYCLTGLAVACMVMIVALLPSPDARVEGGVELIGREKKVEIYGPDLPTAMVSGYVAPVGESVFVQDDADEENYVYAVPGAENYHRSDCKYAYASAQKLTLYEAFFHGYTPCTRCNPPLYVAGTM